MIPLALAGAGLACLIGAALALRAVGPGYRIARLLAATPSASLEEAIELARGGGQHYVRVSGRIASDEEFPDEHDRPLVYRRKRLEIADRTGRWQVLADEREAVAFGVEARTTYVEVDAAALEEGLVVLTREALGRAAELGTELPPGSDPDAAARLIVEQVSAVEHATVAGVPTIVDSDHAALTAGTGRPLILTTVELPAAMRLLARGHRSAVIGATLLLIVGVALWLAALVALLTTG